MDQARQATVEIGQEHQGMQDVEAPHAQTIGKTADGGEIPAPPPMRGHQGHASGQQLRDYQAGYSSGYDGASRVQQGNGSVRIGSDHNISWLGPANGQLYVQVDNNPRQLFAAGASGTQLAPWMTSGHLYVFVLQDPNGNEIARDQSDLRQRRSDRSR